LAVTPVVCVAEHVASLVDCRTVYCFSTFSRSWNAASVSAPRKNWRWIWR